jgi:hypothetical protein
MKKYSKIADGLASWLNFELRVGREGIFSESYIANPIAQILNYRFGGRVISEVDHPKLAGQMSGAGKRPKIDFVVKQEGSKKFLLAVETKWISKSNNLLRDIIRDVIRLDMLLPEYAEEAILIVAGKKKDFQRIFNDKHFKGHPDNKNSRELLPMSGYEKNSIRFNPIPKFRKKLFENILEIYKNNYISNSISIERAGPFPINANQNQYEVYLFRLKNKNEIPKKFLPKELYDLE